MKETRLLMGMPITIEVIDQAASRQDIEELYAYFQYVDETFSTYKESSEISRINAEQHPPENWSTDMKEVMTACQLTSQETDGYFYIYHQGKLDPSGYVKGWAIQNAARLLAQKELRNWYIDAGGDIFAQGLNNQNQPWRVGIRNPFNHAEVIKCLSITNLGVATSGTYLRGQHIYNPHQPNEPLHDIVSITVVGPTIVDADRYATAAFAMGRKGIEFIASLPHFAGYMIDRAGIATFTLDFPSYVLA